MSQKLMNLDRVRDHPDIGLAKPRFQSLLKLPEKSAGFEGVLHINDHFDVAVFEDLASLRPGAAQALWRPSDTAELADQLSPRLAELFFLDRKPVVIPGGQENFVPLEGHRLG